MFRLDVRSGYVDTVPFGAFRRDLFDRIGLYDERLTRNQDNELNYRIRKNGARSTSTRTSAARITAATRCAAS